VAQKTFWIRLALAGAIAAIGCATETTESPPPAPPGQCDVSATAQAELGVSGPFHVGHRVLNVTYSPPGVPGDRTIPVHIWYPTNATDGDLTTYVGLFDDPNSFMNAPLAAPLSGCGYPTIVYSHGHQGFAGTGAQLMRHFASHGWVGIAPDHVQNLLTDNVDPRPPWMYYARSLDISASLDAVEKLPTTDPLYNKVATDRVIMAGHSYGTLTTWATAGATYDMDKIHAGRCAEMPCSDAELAEFTAGVRDPRVIAVMPLAGSYSLDWFGNTGFQSMQIPMLQMTGSANDVGAADSWDLTTGINLSWIEIEGGCHESFALGTACSTLPTAEGYGIVDTYAMAFSRYHLLGDRSEKVSGIVDGTQTVSARVTFRKR
jgi:predicted dienelactone hydrolase